MKNGSITKDQTNKTTDEELRSEIELFKIRRESERGDRVSYFQV